MEPTKPPFYDSALIWFAAAGVLEVIGAVPVVPVIGQAIATSSTDVWASNWFKGGVAIMCLGVLAAWWALTLFLAHSHIRRRHQAAQLAPGSIVHNYHAPVTIYGVHPVETPVQQVPGGVQTTEAAATPLALPEAAQNQAAASEEQAQPEPEQAG